MSSAPRTSIQDERGRAQPRAMMRCECAEMPFAEVARRVRDEGQALEDVKLQTGCARTCTACLPDLESYLASR